MTRELASVLDEIEEHTDGECTPAGVLRVDVTSRGGLGISYDRPHARWFRVEDGRLAEAEPGNDPDVPLARELLGGSILAYRPRRRVVVSDARRDGVWKGVRTKRLEPLLARLAIARSACSRAGLEGPRVVESSRQLSAVALARHRGRPLSLDDPADVYFRIGAALREFQATEWTPDLKVHAASDELAGLDELARRSGLVGLEASREWRATLATLDRELVTALGHGPLGLCHRDLHDGQILVDRSSLALLDFDLLCVADIALDAANLSAHLALRALQSGWDPGAPRVAVVTDSLLDGFDATEDAGAWARLRFYQATTFLRLALLYALRPRWRRLSAPLTRLAQRCLREVVA